MGPNVKIKATSAAPVAMVFASSARPLFPPLRRSAIIPEPTTAMSRNAVPRNSATLRRNIDVSSLFKRADEVDRVLGDPDKFFDYENQTVRKPGDKRRHRNRKDPGPDDAAGNAPLDSRESFGRSHTDDGAGDGVSCRNGDPGKGREEECRCTRRLGAKAADRLE